MAGRRGTLHHWNRAKGPGGESERKEAAVRQARTLMEEIRGMGDPRPVHRDLPGYAPTPLRSLDPLARRVGASEVLLKDESFRFGLGAFKGLGDSFAIHRHLEATPDTEVFATAWEGYHTVPLQIMTGYTTAIREVEYDLGVTEGPPPFDMVFLQGEWGAGLPPSPAGSRPRGVSGGTWTDPRGCGPPRTHGLRSAEYGRRREDRARYLPPGDRPGSGGRGTLLWNRGGRSGAPLPSKCRAGRTHHPSMR